MLQAEVEQRLRAALAALQQGRTEEARAELAVLIQAQPRHGDARRLNGVALTMAGDLAGAEAELRAAVGIDKRDPTAHVALAEVLVQRGDLKGAERAYLNALQLDRRLPEAAIGLSTLLSAQGRGAEAVQVTAPLAAGPVVSEAVLTAHATALKGVGRIKEALALNERAVSVAPKSATAEHNLAATLGDMIRPAEAEAATTRAFAKGGDAPETWLVRARALQQLERFDESESAYRQAVRRRPTYAEAHRELAQLIWMRTEDVRAATVELDAALARTGDPMLVQRKAKMLEYAGDPRGAYATVLAALLEAPDFYGLNAAASRHAVLAGEPDAALQLAERATALFPEDAAGRVVLAEACLAVGDATRAAAITEKLRRESPFDQYVIAIQATAWRLLDDPRYHDLFDYRAFVQAQTLDTPRGWGTLEAYLADLKPALERLHPFRTHPLDQSLRHGSQASHLSTNDPVIAAFFAAVDGSIRRYIAALGRGRDPLRKRSLGGYAVKGSWSVRLRPSGFHADHVHTEGWLSSACYIDLPRTVAGSAGREGWIKFGQPGAVTRPPLGAEHYVEPEPGLLALFPSYMWHGTVPFTGDQHRLTVAFDLLPAKSG